MKIFLNLARTGAGFTPCIATGAITGDPGDFVGAVRQFYPLSHLTDALDAAGIGEHRYREPVRFVNSGFGGSFLEISAEEGEKLGVLERKVDR
jgi:hypothetical protein